jgi:hypothetical protein
VTRWERRVEAAMVAHSQHGYSGWSAMAAAVAALDAFDRENPAAIVVTDDVVARAFTAWLGAPGSGKPAIRAALEAALRAAPHQTVAELHAAAEMAVTGRHELDLASEQIYAQAKKEQTTAADADAPPDVFSPMEPTPPAEEAENARAQEEFDRAMAETPQTTAKLEKLIRAKARGVRTRQLWSDLARAADHAAMLCSGTYAFDVYKAQSALARHMADAPDA